MKRKYIMRPNVSIRLKCNSNYGLIVDGITIIQKINQHIEQYPITLWKHLYSSGGNLSLYNNCYYKLRDIIAKSKPKLLEANTKKKRRYEAFRKAKQKFGSNVSIPSRDNLNGKEEDNKSC